MIANEAVNDRVDETQWKVAQNWEREFWLRQPVISKTSARRWSHS